MSKRAAFVLTLGAILLAAWYGVRFEGQPRPVDPLQVWALPEVPVWEGQPALFRTTNDPAAIYVLRGVPGSDGRFDALRLDLNSGARSSARIAIGPATGVLRVVAGTGAGKRTLLSLTVVNSSRMEEVRSQLWSDRSKSIAAFSWPEADSWRLYVFALKPAQDRVRTPG